LAIFFFEEKKNIKSDKTLEVRKVEVFNNRSKVFFVQTLLGRRRNSIEKLSKNNEFDISSNL